MKKENLEDVFSSHNKPDLLLSYSRLSDFDRNGPKALLFRESKDLQALKMGNLVDDLLFNKRKFKEIYYISDFNEPTAMLGQLCRIILNNFTELPNIETITKIVDLNNLWSNIVKSDIKLSKWNNDEFWGYLKDKFKSIDKIVITNEEFRKAQNTVDILLTHKFSKELFNPELEHYYQYSFKIKIKHFDFRGILDIISIDHKNKKVYFKDLKTTSGLSEDFLQSFIKYRYYLQEAVYTLAFDEICKTLNLKDYKLAPFEFIYISLKELLPISYRITSKWHNSALNGFKTLNNYKYKGLYQLIDEIYFHWKNQIYDLPMDVYINNGKIDLKDDFIINE